MPVKLRVTHQVSESNEPTEYLFERDRVTIGRGSANHLTLPDNKRIVSTKHAEVRRVEGSYQLVDLGSKNFTYLGGERLDPEQPYNIESGDVFQIGEFEIEFLALDAPEPEAARTVFAADFTNPFEEPAAQMLDALQEIVEAYEEEMPHRRDDALRDAFRNASVEMGTHDAIQQVARQLGMTNAEGAEAEEVPASKEKAAAASVVPSETIGSVLDTMAEAVTQLVGIPWQFRHEFIGQTIMQSPKTAFLYEGNAETLKEHLLDPSLSEEERAKRLDHLRDAAEAVAVHQVAMLNGYKASVMQGAQELMEQLSPEAIERELAGTSKLYDLLPMLASPAIVERLRTTWNELQAGDWSVAEQRIFRPAFIKAYLARMTAVRNPDKNTHNQNTH